MNKSIKILKAKKDPKLKKLTPLQAAFVEEYISNKGNATQAILAISQKEREKNNYQATAVKACNMLKKPNVAYIVELRRKEILEEIKKNTLKQVQDLEEIKNRCMTVKPVMVWDSEEKKQVMKTELVIDPKTGAEKMVGVYEFDSLGAIKSIAEQNKMLGMYATEKKEIKIESVVVKLPDVSDVL